jgi:hypothetical protein
MKLFFAFVFALLAVMAGSLVLLPLLAWASLQDPRLSGSHYYTAVLATLFSTRATLAGMVAIVLGLAAALYAVFLAGSDRHKRKAARPVFWTALGICSVAMFALLLFVNYLGLQAGEVKPISRWVWR